jgi:hypothetical protein
MPEWVQNPASDFHFIECIDAEDWRNAAALTWADRLVVVDPQSRPLRDEIAGLAGAR